MSKLNVSAAVSSPSYIYSLCPNPDQGSVFSPKDSRILTDRIAPLDPDPKSAFRNISLILSG